MKKRSPITQASHKNIPGSAQMLSHTAREGASWRSKQRQGNMCKSQWEEKGKNNVTLSSLAPQWSWNEFGCIGNCFFQFKKCPKRFRNSRKAKTQKNNHFFFLIILGKPETQIKILLKECQSFLCTSPHSHSCFIPDVDEVRMPGATVLISTKSIKACGKCS